MRRHHQEWLSRAELIVAGQRFGRLGGEDRRFALRDCAAPPVTGVKIRLIHAATRRSSSCWRQRRARAAARGAARRVRSARRRPRPRQPPRSPWRRPGRRRVEGCAVETDDFVVHRRRQEAVSPVRFAPAPRTPWTTRSPLTSAPSWSSRSRGPPSRRSTTRRSSRQRLRVLHSTPTSPYHEYYEFEINALAPAGTAAAAARQGRRQAGQQLGDCRTEARPCTSTAPSTS